MIGKLLMVGALAATCAFLPAQAQERRPKGQDYSEKKICKVQGRAGSRLGGKRTCKSQAEWDQEAREARLTAAHIQSSTSACLMGSNDPTNANVGVPVCSNQGP